MKWNDNTKEIITYAFAGFSLVFGVGLTIAGFIVDPLGVVADSILWVLGQAFVFTGACLGINLSITHAKNQVKAEVGKEMKHYLEVKIDEKIEEEHEKEHHLEESKEEEIE